MSVVETATKEGLRRRFKPYPAHKDSGLEWLGKIPEHWEVKRLRSTVSSCQNGVWGDEPDGLHDIACVRVADFDRVRFRVNIDDPTIRSIDSKDSIARGLKQGDLLLEKSGGGEKQPVGAVVHYDHSVPAVCSNFVARVVLAKGFDSRFLAYLHAALYSLRINTRHIKQSTGIQNLDSASYLDEAVGLPVELDEQLAIAKFLDRETARIDALVAKKQRLIELLREQRTAFIGAAVDSSQDQAKVKLGYYVDLLPGFAFPSDGFSHDDDDMRLLRGVNILPDRIDWSERVMWPFSDVPPYERYLLLEGDLVFGMDRPWVSAGVRVAEVGVADIPSLLLQRVARLRAKNGLSQRFLKLILSGPEFQAYFEPILTGVSVPHVSPQQIMAFEVQIPSLDQQNLTAQKLHAELARIESLRNKLALSIEYLQELRIALISAAVTGKIDVREEVI